MIESVKVLAEAAKETIAETLKEISSEIAVKDIPLETIDMVGNGSLEALDAENQLLEMKSQNKEHLREIQVKQLAENRENGKNREVIADKELREEYTEKEGCKIHSEVYLRDENGSIVKDSFTGEGRRIDFVIDKNGEIIKSVEITSKTASKEEQIAKEQRIRAEGGNYIKDRETGELIKIPENITTEIKRYK